MFELVDPATAEQSVKKSRFLATAIAVASEDEAKAALARTRQADAN
jgi:putative IMPACT (imprinted ancient) family translation regulator